MMILEPGKTGTLSHEVTSAKHLRLPPAFPLQNTWARYFLTKILVWCSSGFSRVQNNSAWKRTWLKLNGIEKSKRWCGWHYTFYFTTHGENFDAEMLLFISLSLVRIIKSKDHYKKSCLPSTPCQMAISISSLPSQILIALRVCVCWARILCLFPEIYDSELAMASFFLF